MSLRFLPPACSLQKQIHIQFWICEVHLIHNYLPLTCWLLNSLTAYLYPALFLFRESSICFWFSLRVLWLFFAVSWDAFCFILLFVSFSFGVLRLIVDFCVILFKNFSILVFDRRVFIDTLAENFIIIMLAYA